jgi:hypothetical protein
MILEAKRNESCEQDNIIKKINELEHMTGLLDTAFSYLNISNPTDEEKYKASLSLEGHWILSCSMSGKEEAPD